MDYYDIVVYWGYGQMNHVWSLLLLLRPWMGHGGRAPQTKETLPDFCENMDLDKWDTTMWYRVTQNPQEFHWLTSCQRDPRVLGRHMVSPSLCLIFSHNFVKHKKMGDYCNIDE